MKKINILGKINKDNYQEFNDSDFLGYEVYLKSQDDFEHLPKMTQRLNIISVHQPSRNFNLCSNDEVGKESFNTVLKMLESLNAGGYRKIVVVHGAFFDEDASSKPDHLKILAERIDELAQLFPKIKITLENDVWFFNQSKNKRALLVEADDFLELKKYLKTNLYITLDFEHIWISSVFKNFIDNSPQFYFEIKNLADLDKPEAAAVKKVWLEYLQKNKNKMDDMALKFLKEYEKLKSSIINFHLNGSNMLKYWFDSKTFIPLIGEHLCIKDVDDILNHQLIKNNIKNLTEQSEANLVLEIWPRNTKQYVVELKKSGQIAKKIYA
ncbi:MAG: TIM barrel protein [Patescibacteria group bacterium]|jgi:hypothetical protein